MPDTAQDLDGADDAEPVHGRECAADRFVRPEEKLVADGRVAVGSYEDLQPMPDQPIDRNPSIPCRICGEKCGWMDYWKERITGRDRDPREVPYECDDCRDEIEEMRRRLSDNASLDGWGDIDER